MTYAARTSTAVVSKTARALVMCLALLYPASALADLYVVLREGQNGRETRPVTRQTPKTAPLLGLNDKGDLAIRYREAALTIAYAPDGTNGPQRQQILSMNQFEPPALPGISLALSIAF